MSILLFSLLLLSAYLLALFQSAVSSEILPHSLKPDLMLILIIYLGISPYLVPGAILVSFAGLLSGTFSGSPAGLFLFVYLIIFFFIKLLGKFLILGETIRLRLILVALALSFQAGLIIFVPTWLGISENISLPPVSWVLTQVLMTCAVCWPLFYLFRKLENIRQIEPSSLES